MCLKDKEVAGVVLTSDLCWIMLKALLVIKADWREGGGAGGAARQSKQVRVFRESSRAPAQCFSAPSLYRKTRASDTVQRFRARACLEFRV